MRFLILLIFTTCVPFAFSQTTERKKSEKEISVCPIQLTSGAADFRLSYRFIVKTDENGAVKKVTQLSKDATSKFIKIEKVTHCIKSWKLNPSEDYFVSVFVATIFTDGYENYILISSKSETLKIKLPPLGEELPIKEKQK